MIVIVNKAYIIDYIIDVKYFLRLNFMLNLGLGDIDKQIDAFISYSDLGNRLISDVKSALNQPEYHRPPKTFSLADVLRLTGLSRNTIRNKEKERALEYSKVLENPEKKKEYTLKDIHDIRTLYNKGFWNGQMHRPENCSTLTLAMAMFKGGVGKTTHSTHLAADCAIQGLKTLLVDLDSQASATLMMGLIPSLDLDETACIYDALVEDHAAIRDIIKPSHYYGLDIIPAGLSLASANVNLHQSSLNNVNKLGAPLLRLKNALSLVKDEYDVIILDCPPNHEAVALNALFCADSFIVPITPNMLSFSSANAFFSMLSEISQMRKKYIGRESYNRLFKMLITNDPRNTESLAISNTLKSIYGAHILTNTMAKTVALDRAFNDIGLLYDMPKGSLRGDRQAFNRAVSLMTAVNQEIIDSFKVLWEQENSSQQMEVTHVKETVSA